MKILIWMLLSIGGIVVLVVALFIFLWIRSIRVSLRRDQQLSEMTAPVISAIDENKTIDSALVFNLCENPLTRAHFLSELLERKREDVFPEQFRSLEQIAESDMVRWLYHGNELGCAPDKIEMVMETSVTEGFKFGRCFLFRFKVSPPHWASSRSWMAGVAGPFWEGDQNACMGENTFSELNPYEGKSHEEHLIYISSCANRFGWVMPNPTS